MRRREFVAALGSVAWPLAARAQHPTMAVIGMLGSDSPEHTAARLRSYSQGVNSVNAELVTKGMELLHEVIAERTSMAVLVNPASPMLTETAVKDAHAAARSLGLKLDVVQASTVPDLETAFATLAELQAG